MVRPLARGPLARARWLVLAPHPDDETIGAGALIAQAASAGRLAAVAYLTDGSGSHPAGTPGLVATRRREARAALRRLTRGAVPRVIDLGWQDAHPHADTDPGFTRSVRRLARFAEAHRVDAIATTGRDETHCDHVACAIVAAAVRDATRRRIALLDYAVWPSGPATRPAWRTAAMPAGRRRHALQAHRSQLGPSRGAGFRLPRERLAMPAADLLRERRR